MGIGTASVACDHRMNVLHSVRAYRQQLAKLSAPQQDHADSALSSNRHTQSTSQRYPNPQELNHADAPQTASTPSSDQRTQESEPAADEPESVSPVALVSRLRGLKCAIELELNTQTAMPASTRQELSAELEVFTAVHTQLASITRPSLHRVIQAFIDADATELRRSRNQQNWVKQSHNQREPRSPEQKGSQFVLQSPRCGASAHRPQSTCEQWIDSSVIEEVADPVSALRASSNARGLDRRLDRCTNEPQHCSVASCKLVMLDAAYHKQMAQSQSVDVECSQGGDYNMQSRDFPGTAVTTLVTTGLLCLVQLMLIGMHRTLMLARLQIIRVKPSVAGWIEQRVKPSESDANEGNLLEDHDSAILCCIDPNLHSEYSRLYEML